MKDLNKNLKVISVEVNNWRFDEQDNEYPVAYDVNLCFHGVEYIMYFTVDDIKKYDDYGLRNSGCEGPSELFDSMESYFESHEVEAKMLIDMMRKAWDEENYYDSPYDFVGNKKEE